jgi:UDP-N-acetylglucosamine enolpyruvyl transferase
MSASFEIIGGNKLKGTVIPQGAKNEALQVICAVLLTAEKVDMSNIPEIVDVMKLIDLLLDLLESNFPAASYAIRFDVTLPAANASVTGPR